MTQKISRNQPCPCGSGRKYKRCCAVSARSHDDPPNASCDFHAVTFEFTVFGPDPAGNEAAVTESIRACKEAMFQHWLDDPRPDFDGQSARQAVHEPRFRQILESELERMETVERTIVTPKSRMDLGFLREALGFASASVQ